LSLENKDVLVRYLLGDLSHFDRERLEKESLANNELLEELNAVENDLMDSYVRGELPTKLRQQFEEKFLDSPEKFERLEVAKLLMDPAVRAQIATTPIQSQEKPGSRWGAFLWAGSPRLQFAFGCGLVVALAAAILAVQNWRLHAELAKLRSEQIQQQGRIDALNATAQTPDNLARETRLAEVRPKSEPPRTIPVVATFTLSIGSERGDGGLNQFSIPASVARARLKIPLSKNDYQKYRVTLKKPEGEQVFVRDAVPIASGKQLIIQSPVGVLSDGDYILTVTGVDSNGEAKAVVDNYSIRFTHVP
jgi:hypothetical protein